MRRAMGLSSVSALVLGCWAGVALACPLCSASRGDSPTSYYGATALLCLVPIAIFGSIALWLRRNARRVAGHDVPAGPPSGGAAPPDSPTQEN